MLLPMKTYTRQQAVAFIKKQQGTKNIDDFAQDLGVSGALLRMLYSGKISPGPKLGFRRVELFFREKDGNGRS